MGAISPILTFGSVADALVKAYQDLAKRRQLGRQLELKLDIPAPASDIQEAPMEVQMAHTEAQDSSKEISKAEGEPEAAMEVEAPGAEEKAKATTARRSSRRQTKGKEGFSSIDLSSRLAEFLPERFQELASQLPQSAPAKPGTVSELSVTEDNHEPDIVQEFLTFYKRNSGCFFRHVYD